MKAEITDCVWHSIHHMLTAHPTRNVHDVMRTLNLEKSGDGTHSMMILWVTEAKDNELDMHELLKCD